MVTILDKDSRAASDRARAEQARLSSITVVSNAGQALVVSNVDDLKVVQIIENFDRKICHVLGYHTSNDGGGGFFEWREESNSPPDFGIVFESSTNLGPTGRWHRIYEGRVNIKWFGIKGDNSNRVENTTRFQYILDNFDDIYIPNGQYSFNGGISSIKQRCSITGESTDSVLSFTESTLSGAPFCIAISGSIERIADLDGNLIEKSSTVLFDSNHNLGVDDLIIVHNSEDGSFNPSRNNQKDGEYLVVKRVLSSTEIETTVPVFSNYILKDDFIHVYKCDPCVVEIRNLTITPKSSDRGLRTNYTRDSIFDNIKMNSSGFSKLYTANALNASFTNIALSDGISAPSNNYAFYFDGCQNCKIVNSYIHGSTSIDFGGSSGLTRIAGRFNTIQNCTMIGRFTSHGNQERTLISNCFIQDDGVTFIRGGSFRFINNTLFAHGFGFGESISLDHDIIGNKMVAIGQYGGAYNTFINLGDQTASGLKGDSSLNIKDNDIDTTHSAGLRLLFTNSSEISIDDPKISITISGNSIKANGRAIRLAGGFYQNFRVYNNYLETYGDNSAEFNCGFANGIFSNNITENCTVFFTSQPASQLLNGRKQVLHYNNNVINAAKNSSVCSVRLAKGTGLRSLLLFSNNYIKGGENPSSSGASTSAIFFVNQAQEVNFSNSILETDFPDEYSNSFSFIDVDELRIENIKIEKESANYTNIGVLIPGIAIVHGDGSPIGVLAPRYIGRNYFDATNQDYYKSTSSSGNTNWKKLTP